MEMMALATLSLVAGVVDDLRSRKVHNALLLALFPLLLIGSVYFRGVEGSVIGLTSMVLALAVTIPLFMGRVLGGGDVKLFILFSFCVDPRSMFNTLVFSIIWGGVFAVTRAVVNNQLPTLLRSTYKIATRQRVQPQEIHKIPYTFSLLLGWFTHLTWMRTGGLL